MQSFRGVGKSSGVTHGKRFGQPAKDDSSSQFYSVIGIDGNYSFVGLGDCLCSIITPDSMRSVPPKNISYGFVGTHLSPRKYMRNHPHEEGLPRDAKLDFDDPLVRKGVDVQELAVSKGGIIFMCSDGYALERRGRDFTLDQAFHDRTVKDGVDDIMKEVLKNRKEYHDNIAVCAMRV